MMNEKKPRSPLRSPLRSTANLWTRNLAWLEANSPSLARRLEESSARRFCKAIKRHGRIINLETGGTRLYEPNALAQAKQEVAAYLARKKFFLAPRSEINVLPSRQAVKCQHLALARDFRSVFLKDERAQQAREDAPHTMERSLLVVFGLGLGYHIAPLLQRLKPCNVCILETRRENAFFAAHTQNIARWDAMCASRKGRLFLVVQEETEALEQDLSNILSEELHFFARNFFFYRHATEEAALRLLEQRMPDILQSALVNKGFFEDQIRMLENGTRNLSARASTAFLKPFLRLRQRREALILANGPSLDDALPYLKSLCRGRVVFSCGSTLYTLLKNGIQPDYQCEIENIYPDRHHIENIHEKGYALDNITLLAAITVQEDVVSSFCKRVLFMRVGVPFTCLTDLEALSFAAPSVANTALACAHAIGFSNIYLLGVDCGYKQGRAHHAQDAIHFLDKKLDRHEQARQRQSHLRLRGNFGGYVHSHEVLLATKQRLEFEARAHPLNHFHNCSDGALLKGFVPMLPSLIEPLQDAHDSAHDSAHDNTQWHERCPRLSLTDARMQQRLQQARNHLSPCAQRVQRLFASLEQASSIVSLQELHNGLRDLFAPKSYTRDTPAEKSEEARSQEDDKSREFVLSFYTGSAFIFFSHAYQCFMNSSPRQWRRLRHALSAHVQHRLRVMDASLKQVLAETLTTFSDAERQRSKKETEIESEHQE